MLENYVDVDEAARILKVHPETVRRLMRNKVLAAIKIGNKWIVERHRLDVLAGSYDRRRGRVRRLT